MSKWTNIQTGEVIDSPGVPSGGSDAGWVPGATSPAPTPSNPTPTPTSTPTPVPMPTTAPTPTPTPALTQIWTNIITGAVTTGAMPAGGSNTGWVPGTTSVGGAVPTPYIGTPSNPASAQPAVVVPPGYTLDPAGALMPLNPTPTTITPFQTNALNETGVNLDGTPKEPEQPDLPTTALDLTKPQDTSAIKRSDEMAQAEMRINNAYNNYKSGGLNPNQIRISGAAGDDFIRQAAMAGKGRLPTTEEMAQLRGGTTGGVLAAFGLSGRIIGSGETNNPMLETTAKINWNPALNDEQKLGIIALVQNKKRTDWNAADIANYNFATGSNEKLITTPGSTGASAPPDSSIAMPDPDNEDQQIIDIKAFGDKLTADLKTIQDKITAASTNLADFQQSYALGQDKLASQDIPLAFKVGQEASFANQNSIKEKNLIAKLGILQDEKTGVIDRANIQMKIDDAIYQRKKDIITEARQYRSDQQEALATMVNLLAGSEITPEISATIARYAKDTGLDAGLIIKALETKHLDKDNAALLKAAEDNKSEFKQIGVDENGDPTYGFVNSMNQTVKPINTSASTGQAFFTDANGDNWNIAGWAADDSSKMASMQRISNQIGKVTNANIDAKVKQFTPGLTADMIKNTSARTGVSWEALMTMAAQESTGGTSPVAQKNFNYGGLKFNNQEWIKPLGGTMGTSTPSNEDGGKGHYIKFPTPQAGLDAMGALMASYGKVAPKSNEARTTAENYVKIGAKISDIKGKDTKETAAIIKEFLDIKANSGEISKGDAIITAGLQDKVKEIDYLIKETSFWGDGSGVVGPNPLARMSPINTVSGKAEEFVGTVKTLIAKETLDALINLKKSGGTLGALSDQERVMLQNSASKISSWQKTNILGKTYWAVSQDTFRKELAKLKDLTNRAINNATNGTGIVNSLEQNLSSNPGMIDDYNTILENNPNMTDDEINQALGFN